MQKNKIYIYSHRDFDGIVSGVLAYHFLAQQGYVPVIADFIDHNIRKKWESGKFKVKKPFAVVDFIYRKDAFAYFDHHSPYPKNHRGTKYYCFDENERSCASLILKYASDNKISLPRKKDLEELVRWASIFDFAPSYDENGISALETITPTKPEMRVVKTLQENSTGEKKLYKKIINYLIENPSLKDLAKEKFISRKANAIIKRQRKALEHFEENSCYAGNGIVIYNASEAEFLRYAPFYFYPDSLVYLCICKTRTDYELKVGQNPWNKASVDFFINQKKLDLGGLFAELKIGGGHPGVASANFKDYNAAAGAEEQVLGILREKLKGVK